MTESERAAWLELRRQYVGSSEAGALLGVSPWMTRFRLWHAKRGDLSGEDFDTEAMAWGRRHEATIAEGLRDETGWELIRPNQSHIAHPTVPGLGASPDFLIAGHHRGPGVAEMKSVDAYDFARWEDGQPPIWYVLQLQTQLAVTGYQWGVLACLVGGNRLRVFDYERHAASIAILERETVAFWDSVRANVEPALDYEADADTIAQLYRHSTPGKHLDIPREEWTRVAGLCERYEGLGRIVREAESKREAVKAEILTVIGDAERAGLGPWTISAKTQAAHVVKEHTRNESRPVRVTWSEKRAKVLGMERETKELTEAGADE